MFFYDSPGALTPKRPRAASFLCQVSSSSGKALLGLPRAALGRQHCLGCREIVTAWILKCWGWKPGFLYTRQGVHHRALLPTPGLPLLTASPEALVNNPDLSARTWHSAIRQCKAGSRELSFRGCPGHFREHWLPEATASCPLEGSSHLPPLLTGTDHAICKSAQHCNVLYYK